MKQEQKKWVVAVYRDGHPSRMTVQTTRPAAVKELEKIGSITREKDRQAIRNFLEESSDRVFAILAEDWAGSGWIHQLSED